jgi:hypothetical protein
VFKKNLTSNGIIDKYKASHVAKGYN